MKIVRARLVKRKTHNGLQEFDSAIPLGKIYNIDIDSLQTLKLHNIEKHVSHKAPMVIDIDTGEYLPFECIEVIKEDLV